MHDFLQGGGAEKWLAELGVSDAPLTRTGLGTALQFFHTRMPDLPRTMRFAFLKAMDLHKPVCLVTLAPPSMLSAFRKANEDPLKLFYTKAGTSVLNLGLNPANREFRRFRVARPVQVLESVAAAAIDKWTDDRRYFVASGGGRQYIIPQAHAVLELCT